jgi:hypothetical protein
MRIGIRSTPGIRIPVVGGPHVVAQLMAEIVNTGDATPGDDRKRKVSK